MKILAGTILTVFIAMALFSFGVIDVPMTSGDMANCLATKIHNGACPPTNSSFDTAVFHTSAFQAFGVAVLSSLFALLLLSMAWLLASLVLPLVLALRFSIPRLAPVPLDFKSVREKQRALARFELSPTR